MPTVPYVKQTWTDGVSALSAARMAVIESGIYELSFAPSAKVYHSSTQAITSSTETALAFNTEVYDTVANGLDVQHDTVTNNSRLTCRYAGKYHVTANCEFVANATGYRWLTLRVNGTAAQYLGLDRRVGHATVGGTLLVSADLDLAVNDYVQAFVFQDSGGNLNVSAASALLPFVCQMMWHRVA
jgi:hypothetical protein